MCCAKCVRVHFRTHTNDSPHQQFHGVTPGVSNRERIESYEYGKLSLYLHIFSVRLFLPAHRSKFSTVVYALARLCCGFSHNSLSLIKIADSRVSIQRWLGFVCANFVPNTKPHRMKKVESGKRKRKKGKAKRRSE